MTQRTRSHSFVLAMIASVLLPALAASQARPAFARTDTVALRRTLDSIAATHRGVVGYSVINLDTGERGHAGEHGECAPRGVAPHAAGCHAGLEACNLPFVSPTSDGAAVMFRSLFAGVALALVASEAGAQITTYVAPARTTAPQLLAAADSARRDSVASATVTNMKAWVDSAAGVAVPAHVGDSMTVDPGRPVATTFSEGAVAPATASTLPLLAFGGVMAIGLGAVLISTRPRR